jgi:hypothetical protein
MDGREPGHGALRRCWARGFVGQPENGAVDYRSLAFQWCLRSPTLLH